MEGAFRIINPSIEPEKTLLKKITHDPLSCPGEHFSETVEIVSGNSLIGAVHAAFDQHLPLVLCPDVFHIIILQNLAVCVKESLKDTEITEKVEIVVRNDHISLGTESTPDWADTIGKFTEELGKHFDDRVVEAAKCDYSTSTSISVALSGIALMDIYEPFANFTAVSFCGIPSIYLRGTLEDWTKLLEKCTVLSMCFPHFNWWFDKLLPLLQKFCELHENDAVDLKYWQSFYKYEEHSGGNDVSGHINYLFPYTFSARTRKFSQNCAFSGSRWPCIEHFPALTSRVPVVWKNLLTGETRQLCALGGINHAIQHENGSIEPVGNWRIYPIDPTVVSPKVKNLHKDAEQILAVYRSGGMTKQELIEWTKKHIK